MSGKQPANGAHVPIKDHGGPKPVIAKDKSNLHGAATSAGLCNGQKTIEVSKCGTSPFHSSTGRAWRADPSTVIDVRFTEFTSDSILRHATFMGLREEGGG